MNLFKLFILLCLVSSWGFADSTQEDFHKHFLKCETITSLFKTQDFTPNQLKDCSEKIWEYFKVCRDANMNDELTGHMLHNCISTVKLCKATRIMIWCTSDNPAARRDPTCLCEI